MTRAHIFAEIIRERERQSVKWGGAHPWGRGDCSSVDVEPIVKVAVLSEECGEVARATLENDAKQLRLELVQVAAVAVAWLESMGAQVPFATLDDNMPEHPKVIGLSDAAFRLHVSGIIYCARHTTDGNVAGEKVRTLVPRFKRSALAELVDRGMWLPVMDGAAYYIHDYLQWNLSREQIERRKEARRKSGRQGAEKRWGQ